jgi:hypothetical protein
MESCQVHQSDRPPLEQRRAGLSTPEPLLLVPAVVQTSVGEVACHSSDN